MTTEIEKAGQQQMVGGQFVSVGAESISIQDITISGDFDDEGAWIKWWDTVNKKYSADAVYVTELYKDGEAIVPKTAGWGDADWEILDKTFVPGEGFWWGVNNDKLSLTLSGEVVQPSTKYVARTLLKAGQQQMIINAFPTALDIQSLKIDGDFDDEGAWIKWWDTVNKKYSADAVYVTELYKDGEAIVPKTAGWGDADWEILDKSFNPGEGFWWGVNNDNLTINIPNPFYVKPEDK